MRYRYAEFHDPSEAQLNEYGAAGWRVVSAVHWPLVMLPAGPTGGFTVILMERPVE